MQHQDDEAGETKEYRRERNGKRAKLAAIGGVAGIILAVPITLGWVGDAFRIAQTPARVDSVEATQKQIFKDQQEMKESLARIEGALHINKTPKQKDEQP